MRLNDFQFLAFGAIRAQRMRSFLTALGIAVGIAAVVLLTSIGEGIHRFVLAEFTQFGTNIIGIQPGKSSTHGGSAGVFGSVRPLTVSDGEALRQIPYVTAMVPMVQGNAEVEAGGKTRRTTVYGTNGDFPGAFTIRIGTGTFLPANDAGGAERALAVLGSKLRQELFASSSPLGERIRIGGARFLVVGVMESKGQVLGFDLDDTVYIPVARSLELFNRNGVMEVHLAYNAGAPVAEIIAASKRILTARHGTEDFTVTTQQQMLDVLGSVLDVLTFAVGALGGISLLVGAVGILTIMTIAVTERTGEIGLLRALGATRGQILVLFLGEAVVLAALGGLAGLIAGAGGGQLLHLALPALPVQTPWVYVAAAEAIAAVIGLLAGVLPARRAAGLDPVVALRAE
ncbi:MAG: ABC transporter permease [Gammaproteobacteria bacterium]|nr:ABC transporter permease [Gammaproteobacteria bacterium]